MHFPLDNPMLRRLTWVPIVAVGIAVGLTTTSFAGEKSATRESASKNAAMAPGCNPQLQALCHCW
jgi:hypothetical protein